MTRLLHISASPRGDASESLGIAQAFLDAFTEANPGAQVDEVDLFDGTLPTFGRLAAGAKMAIFAGGQPTAEQAAEWDTAKAVFDRFAGADAYLFSIPMWNSGVPYVLKQWIDIVTQPGWVFGFSPDQGYQGLITGKRAATMYTSGVFSVGAPLAYGADFHSAYFRDWLRFAGFADDAVTEVRFQPTVLTATPDDDREAAITAARAAGSAF